MSHISVIRLFPSYLSILPSLRAKSTDIMADLPAVRLLRLPAAPTSSVAMAGKSPGSTSECHQKHVPRSPWGDQKLCETEFFGVRFLVFTGSLNEVDQQFFRYRYRGFSCLLQIDQQLVRCNNRREEVYHSLSTKK